MNNDKYDNSNNVYSHPAQPSLRQKLLNALDGAPGTPAAPVMAQQAINLGRAIVILLALQLSVELAQAAHHHPAAHPLVVARVK